MLTSKCQYVFFDPNFAIWDIAFKYHWTNYANILITHVDTPSTNASNACGDTYPPFWGHYYDPNMYSTPPHSRYRWLDKWEVPYIKLGDYKGFEQARYAPQYSFRGIMKTHAEFLLNSSPQQATDILDGQMPNFTNLYMLIAADPRMDNAMAQTIAKAAVVLSDAFHGWYRSFLDNLDDAHTREVAMQTFQNALQNSPGIRYTAKVASALEQYQTTVVQALSARNAGDMSAFNWNREMAILHATKLGNQLDANVHAVPFKVENVLRVHEDGMEDRILEDRRLHANPSGADTFWTLYKTQRALNTWEDFREPIVDAPVVGEEWPVDLRFTTSLVPKKYSTDKAILAKISEKRRKELRIALFILISDDVYKQLFTVNNVFAHAELSKQISQINTEEKAVAYFASRSSTYPARNVGDMAVKYRERNAHAFPYSGEGWTIRVLEKTLQGDFQEGFYGKHYFLYSPGDANVQIPKEVMVLSLQFVQLSRDPMVFLADVVPGGERKARANLYESSIAPLKTKKIKEGLVFLPWPKKIFASKVLGSIVYCGEQVDVDVQDNAKKLQTCLMDRIHILAKLVCTPEDATTKRSVLVKAAKEVNSSMEWTGGLIVPGDTWHAHLRSVWDAEVDWWEANTCVDDKCLDQLDDKRNKLETDTVAAFMEMIRAVRIHRNLPPLEQMSPVHGTPLIETIQKQIPTLLSQEGILLVKSYVPLTPSEHLPNLLWLAVQNTITNCESTTRRFAETLFFNILVSDTRK